MKKITRKIIHEEIREKLKNDGFIVTENGIQTCMDRLLKARPYCWKELSKDQRLALKTETYKKIYSTQASGKYLPKFLSHDDKLYDLGQLQNKLSSMAVEGKKVIKMVAFYKRINRLINNENLPSNFNNPISRKSEIIDMDALLDFMCEYSKKMPALVYKITILSGDYKGFFYIGVTQQTLEERLRGHFFDVTRSENETSEKKVFLALKSAVAVSGKYKAIKVEVLIDGLDPQSGLKQEVIEYDLMVKANGSKMMLNSIPTGGSLGGRGGTRLVEYKNQEYYLAEACRVAGLDKDLKGEELISFINRVHKNYFDPCIVDFDSAVDRAYQLIERGGLKGYRKDTNSYTFQGKIIPYTRIADLAGITTGSLKSRLRERGLFGKEYWGIDITDIALGSAKVPGKKSPFVKDLCIDGYPEAIGLIFNEKSSWKDLSKLTGISDSTLRYWTKKNGHVEFWNKVDNQRV